MRLSILDDQEEELLEQAIDLLCEVDLPTIVIHVRLRFRAAISATPGSDKQHQVGRAD